MNILKKGDIFGMATLFYEEENYLTQITALEKVTLAVFSKENVKKIESDVKQTMAEMNQRHKDTMGYLVRQVSTPKAEEKKGE